MTIFVHVENAWRPDLRYQWQCPVPNGCSVALLRELLIKAIHAPPSMELADKDGDALPEWRTVQEGDEIIMRV